MVVGLLGALLEGDRVAVATRAMMAAGPDPDAMREALRDEGTRA